MNARLNWLLIPLLALSADCLDNVALADRSDGGASDVPPAVCAACGGPGSPSCLYAPGCGGPERVCAVNTCADAAAGLFCGCDGRTFASGCHTPDRPYAYANACGDGGAPPDAPTVDAPATGAPSLAYCPAEVDFNAWQNPDLRYRRAAFALPPDRGTRLDLGATIEVTGSWAGTRTLATPIVLGCVATDARPACLAATVLQMQPATGALQEFVVASTPAELAALTVDERGGADARRVGSGGRRRDAEVEGPAGDARRRAHGEDLVARRRGGVGKAQRLGLGDEAEVRVRRAGARRAPVEQAHHGVPEAMRGDGRAEHRARRDGDRVVERRAGRGGQAGGGEAVDARRDVLRKRWGRGRHTRRRRALRAVGRRGGVHLQVERAREAQRGDRERDLPGRGVAVRIAQRLGRASELERVLRNLPDNALAHSPDGTTIALEVEGAGREVRIAVTDEGPGVPAGDRERIFVPFFRGSHERAAGRGGVGLGLAIVREVVHAHGGTISLTDRPGGSGARFEVRLPTAT